MPRRHEVVNLLLSSGANVCTRDEVGRTVLHHWASVSASVETRCVAELVSAGASTLITAVDHDRRTPLTVLIEHTSGDVRALDFGLELVKRGADANTKDSHERTLLLLCAGKLYGGVGLQLKGLRSLIIGELVQLGASLDACTADGKTALHFAAQNGHEETVCQLIKLGANVDAVAGQHGKTALLSSMQKKEVEVSTKLISLGADANTPNEDGETTLHNAAKGGHSNHVQELAKASADTEARDKHGSTPLLLAADNGHTKTVCALADADAAVDACNGDGETAIHLAAKNGHAETIAQLIMYGAPFESFDSMGRTPLFLAVQGGFTKTVRELHRAGANLEATGENGNTALHTAVITCQNEVVRYLVQAGANVQALDRAGQSALLLAAKSDFNAAATELLQAGANADRQDDGGDTPLFVALQRGNGELCCELVRYGAKVDVDISFFRCLDNAIEAGDVRLLSRLVEIGASVNECNKDGSSALHIALSSEHPKLAEWIIKHGGNVSLANKFGQTPLHIAAMNNFTSIATKLLEVGASVEVRDTDGNSPLSVAAKRGNGELCCELACFGATVDDTISFLKCVFNAVKAEDVGLLAHLVKIGASVAGCDENSSSALHVALTHRHVELAEWIIEHGGDVDASLANASGMTPLHLAAQLHSVSLQSRLHLIKLLLAKGADPTAMTRRSQTALDMAKWRGDDNVVAVLEKAELALELTKASGVAVSPDSVAIRFGGPPGAGKSTLTAALQVTRVRGFLRNESQKDEGATNMQQRTKGINCQTFVDEKSSRFMIFDLGGHGEFLATHQMFIGDGSVPVIDCVVVSALDEQLKDNVLKWCSLFASRNQPIATPWPLLIIATRADIASQQQKNAVISVYRDIERTFSDHFRFPCSEPIFIDARKSWNKLTVELRQLLNRLHQELVAHDESQRKPAVCQNIEENLPALRKTTSSPVVLKEQFIKFMLPRIGLQDQTEVVTPAIVSLFDKALKYLSGYATILSFSQPLVQHHIVINPQWLLSDIVGRLMAEPPLPGPHIHYDNGYAKTGDVVAALETEHLPGREALEMVAGLGFCLQQKSADTVLNPSKLSTHRLAVHWRRTAFMIVNAGRRLKCKGTVAIASAFFSHLQVHFYRRYLSDYDERLPMWRGGLRLVGRQRSSVEALIESDPSNRSIDIIVRGEDGSEEECSQLLHSLTEETLLKATEISPGSQLRLFFLSKLELDELSPAGLPSRPLVEYSEERVLRAISRGECVTDGKASTPENPDKLLLPRHFQQRSVLNDELKAESAEPLNQTLSTEEWRVVLLRVANAVNSYGECNSLAEGLQLNVRGEDIVKKLLEIDPRRLTSDIAYHLFERWLQHGAVELSTEQRRRKLNGVFRVNLRRSVLCNILNDELRARHNDIDH